MNPNKRDKSEITEKIIDAGCLIVSFVILFNLPYKTGFLFYLLFGISAFLFCIGFFRMGFLLDTNTDKRFMIFTNLVFTILGIVFIITGLFLIFHDRGSGRSITITTLLLIEANLFFAIAGSSAEAPGSRWIVSALFVIAAIFSIIIGIVFVVKGDFNGTSVIIGTILLIEAICLWAMGRGNNPFNTLTSEIKSIPGMSIPIEQMCKDLAEVETQLGYPWIGKIKTIRQNCIIYGPQEDGFYIYGYYHFGRFYMEGSENPFFPDPENANEHMVQPVPDRNGLLLSGELLMEAYENMFTQYMKTGSAVWSTDIPNRLKKDRG